MPPKPKVKITRQHFEGYTSYSFEFDTQERDDAVHDAIHTLLTMSEQCHGVHPSAILLPIDCWTYFAMIEMDRKKKNWEAGDLFNGVPIYPCEWLDEMRPLYDYKTALSRMDTWDA